MGKVTLVSKQKEKKKLPNQSGQNVQNVFNVNE